MGGSGVSLTRFPLPPPCHRGLNRPDLACAGSYSCPLAMSNLSGPPLTLSVGLMPLDQDAALIFRPHGLLLFTTLFLPQPLVVSGLILFFPQTGLAHCLKWICLVHIL